MPSICQTHPGCVPHLGPATPLLSFQHGAQAGPRRRPSLCSIPCAVPSIDYMVYTVYGHIKQSYSAHVTLL